MIWGIVLYYQYIRNRYSRQRTHVDNSRKRGDDPSCARNLIVSLARSTPAYG